MVSRTAPDTLQPPLLRLSNELINMILDTLSPSHMPFGNSVKVYQQPFDEMLGTPLMMPTLHYEKVQEAKGLIKTLFAFGQTSRRLHQLFRAFFYRRTPFAIKRGSFLPNMVYIPLIYLPEANVYLDSLILPRDYISQIQVLQIDAMSLKDLCRVLFAPSLKIKTWRYPNGHTRLIEMERQRFGPLLGVRRLNLLCETREALGFSNGGFGDFALEYVCSSGFHIQLPSLHKIFTLWKNIMWIMPKLEAVQCISRSPVSFEDMGDYPQVVMQFEEDFPDLAGAELWRAEFQLIYSGWNARRQRDTREHAGRRFVEIDALAQALFEYDMEMMPQINGFIHDRNVARDLANED